MFRHRWIKQLLPIGSVAAIVLGIVLAPRLMGTSDPVRAVAYGVGIGLLGSLVLFLALRVWDRRLS
jgi:drug/metabolite transporter (DMT)-like permease